MGRGFTRSVSKRTLRWLPSSFETSMVSRVESVQNRRRATWSMAMPSGLCSSEEEQTYLTLNTGTDGTTALNCQRPKSSTSSGAWQEHRKKNLKLQVTSIQLRSTDQEHSCGHTSCSATPEKYWPAFSKDFWWSIHGIYQKVPGVGCSIPNTGTVWSLVLRI